MKSSRAAEDVGRYVSDESRMAGGCADEVVWPESTADAAEALRVAAGAGHAVTISGAGTGIAGGRVPLGGTVLATDRLNRILDLQVAPGRTGGLARVQAGVTVAALQEAALEQGLWYPPDPTEAGCFVGGSIATNASGARTYRYGATRCWVRRIVVGLADGTLLDLPRGRVIAHAGAFDLSRAAPVEGPRSGTSTLVVPAPDWALPATTKHAAGYFSAPEMDLVDLFIGSEGTLGVVLEADVELIGAPEALISGILFFPDEPGALTAVAAARGDRTAGVPRERASGAHGVTPLALEFFDAAALALLRGKGAPVPREAQAALFFEQAVCRAEEFDPLLEAWGSLAEEQGALADSWLAQEPVEQQRFREFRHQVPVTINETIARRGVRKVSTDTAVPPGRVAAMLAAFRRLLEPAGLESVAFGHIGDDHLHVNVLPRDADQLDAAKQLYAALVRAAVDLGGTISAEHGLGKLKGQDLGLLYPPGVLARMRAIKAALDPRGGLGRGTLFAE